MKKVEMFGVIRIFLHHEFLKLVKVFLKTAAFKVTLISSQLFQIKSLTFLKKTKTVKYQHGKY